MELRLNQRVGGFFVEDKVVPILNTPGYISSEKMKGRLEALDTPIEKSDKIGLNKIGPLKEKYLKSKGLFEKEFIRPFDELLNEKLADKDIEQAIELLEFYEMVGLSARASSSSLLMMATALGLPSGYAGFNSSWC